MLTTVPWCRCFYQHGHGKEIDVCYCHRREVKIVGTFRKCTMSCDFLRLVFDLDDQTFSDLCLERAWLVLVWVLVIGLQRKKKKNVRFTDTKLLHPHTNLQSNSVHFAFLRSLICPSQGPSRLSPLSSSHRHRHTHTVGAD